MKKLKYFAIAIIGFAAVQQANAQGAPLLSGGMNTYVPRISTDMGNTIRFVASEREVVGTPFVNENWTPGVVSFANGQSGSAEKLNYDVIEKVLVTQRDGQEMLFNMPIKEFTLNEAGKDRTFRKVNDNFYEVLYDGETKLLKLHTKAVIEVTAYGAGQPTNKISDEKMFFLVGPNNTLQAVKGDKTLTAALDGQQDALKKFVKNESLNLKKESDMVKLLTYYDSL